MTWWIREEWAGRGDTASYRPSAHQGSTHGDGRPKKARRKIGFMGTKKRRLRKRKNAKR
jgi:hypothetical protein